MQQLVSEEMRQIVGGNLFRKIGRETKRVVKQVEHGAREIRDGFREFDA